MPSGLDQKVGALVWSPLGWGRLTGKIRRGKPLPEVSRLHKTANLGPQVSEEHLFAVVDALDAVAAETGKTVPQVALNWLLQRPTVSSLIIGARNEEQLRQNLAAVGWNLTAEQIAKLDKASAVPLSYPDWHHRGGAGSRRWKKPPRGRRPVTIPTNKDPFVRLVPVLPLQQTKIVCWGPRGHPKRQQSLHRDPGERRKQA